MNEEMNRPEDIEKFTRHLTTLKKEDFETCLAALKATTAMWQFTLCLDMGTARQIIGNWMGETVTTTQAAKICRVKPGTIREWHHRGKIHPVSSLRDGKRGPPTKLWNKAEVEALAEKKEGGAARSAARLNEGDLARIKALLERVAILQARIQKRSAQP